MSTTNSTLPNLGSNPGRRGGNQATNRLSYGTASVALLTGGCSGSGSGRGGGIGLTLSEQV
jgi:hypothetical protein